VKFVPNIHLLMIADSKIYRNIITSNPDLKDCHSNFE
jgi:hypothetical protein